MSEKVEIQFTEELRGKNALNFWVGVGMIVAGVYLWWNDWFSISLFETGVLERSSSGGSYGAGATDLLIDTVCLFGMSGVAIFKLCRKFAAGVMERAGFVTGGIYAWASEEQVVGPVPEDRAVAQMRANYEKIVEIDRRLQAFEAKYGPIDPLEDTQ